MDNLNIRVQGNGETIALLDKLVDTGMLEELVNPNIEDRFYRITPGGGPIPGEDPRTSRSNVGSLRRALSGSRLTQTGSDGVVLYGQAQAGRLGATAVCAFESGSLGLPPNKM